MKMRPRPHGAYAGRIRTIREPKIIRVQMATMIPDGMHGYDGTYLTSGWRDGAATGMNAAPPTDNSLTLDSTVKKLIASGMHPERARALVGRAAHRVHAKHGAGRRAHGLHGLGDDAADAPSPDTSTDTSASDAALLDSVRSHAAATQSAHAAIIARIPAAQAQGADALLKVRNDVEALYADWTSYAMGAKNGVPPFQWDRTNPVDAVLIAVRDDLKDTADMLAANKAQQVLAKQIKDLPKLGIPSAGNPLGINLDVPWYVWAGAAAASAGILGKTLRLW